MGRRDTESCSEPGCGKSFFCRERCHYHYNLALRGGTLPPAPPRVLGTCSFGGCSRPNSAHGLCDGHATQLRKGDPLRPLRSAMTLEMRFAAHVDKNGPVPEHRPELGPCWIWTGQLAGKAGQAYGVLTEGSRENRVEHRATHLAWLFSHGEDLPAGQVACHHCDNPPCVRDEHLFAGSASDNAVDMVQKGRRRGPIGVQQLSAKLTEESVRELRPAYAAGEKRIDLAARFGISLAALHNVATRKTWKHVA